VRGKAQAKETVIGYMPEYGDMDFTGLDSVTPEVFSEITALNKGLWLQELELQKELFDKLAQYLPQEFAAKREKLISEFKK
jgi:phosphoenolpyruvate carboxykinase (GTP)